LHNIQVATNVYKISKAARGGGRDEMLGRTNETSPSPLLTVNHGGH
jgi:hypothetical protein